MKRERSIHAKHGGVHFTQLAHTQEINNFVRELPEEKRENLFEVLQELDAGGYIRLENDGSIWDAHGEAHPLLPNEPNPPGNEKLP